MEEPSVSIAIPTLDRGQVLLETLDALLSNGESAEILVIDQTPNYPPDIEEQLARWNDQGQIRWIRLEKPSIPGAMNVALRAAVGEIVLFLDDDIVPVMGLAAAHAANYADAEVVAVVGQVIQPWQSPSDAPRPKRRKGIWEDFDFPFHGIRRAIVRNCMAGNLSVRRDLAIAVGGFDEQFIGAAYRFETEFCRRLTRRSGKIVFDPQASIRHLKAETGGTRIYGDGVTGSRIEHSAGDYYFAFLESSGIERLCYIAYRMLRTTGTRHYLKKPWKIPAHIICQFNGLALARKLYREKRRERAGAKDTAK